MSGSYIILKKYSQDSRRIRPFPPDEDFNWVLVAIVVVGMMIASANWWQFFNGGFPDPTAKKAEQAEQDDKH